MGRNASGAGMYFGSHLDLAGVPDISFPVILLHTAISRISLQPVQESKSKKLVIVIRHYNIRCRLYRSRSPGAGAVAAPAGTEDALIREERGSQGIYIYPVVYPESTHRHTRIKRERSHV